MKPFMSLRLGPEHNTGKTLDDLIYAIKKYPGCFDDIWITSAIGFPHADEHKKLAAEMRKAADKFRELGLKITLQLANTIGHGSIFNAYDYSGMPPKHAFGPDGTENTCTACPRSKEFRDYLYETVKIYTEACMPDILFIDDDLRMANDTYNCFCPDCMAKFNAIYKTSFSPSELFELINTGNGEPWRGRWIEFNAEALGEVAEIIARAGTEINPDMVFGLEHCLPGYNDFTRVYDALYNVSGKPPIERPDKGIYNDHAPREFLRKTLRMTYQLSRLPEYVTNIRPEHETFPHIAMGKTPHGEAVESAIDLSYGCTALSHAFMVMNNEPIEEYLKIFNELNAWRPYFKRLEKAAEGTLFGGVGMALSKKSYRTEGSPDEPDKWINIALDNIFNLTQIGLPVSYYLTQNCSTFLLDKSYAEAMSDDELKELFKKNVIVSGAALKHLGDRGLEDLTGIHAEVLDNNLGGEVMTDDEVNTNFKGRKWYTTIWINDIESYSLSCSKEARVLSNYVIDGKEANIASALITKSSMGGRVAAFGYKAFIENISSSKRNQILNAVDALSPLPALIKTVTQSVLIPRVTKAGALKCVSVLNETIDHTGEMTLTVRKPVGTDVRILRPTKSDLFAECVHISGDEYEVKIPNIEPWNIITVVFE